MPRGRAGDSDSDEYLSLLKESTQLRPAPRTVVAGIRILPICLFLHQISGQMFRDKSREVMVIVIVIVEMEIIIDGEKYD